MTDELALHAWNRDVMDRAVAPFRQDRASFYLGLAVGGALAAIAAILAVSGFGGDASPERPIPAPPPTVVETGPQYGPGAPEVEEVGTEIEPRRLADAFEAATGHRSAFITHKDGDSVRTVPLRIVRLPFGPVLITEDRNTGGQEHVGAIGLHYLEERDGGLHLVDSWPRAVMGWGWGDPPQWRLTDKFTAYPAIYAWGDFMTQGAVIESATITELRPEGPATSDYIYTGHDAASSRWAGDRAPCTLKGRIANIRKDRSFDVVVTGSRTSIDRYESDGGKFFATRQIPWDMPCDQPAAQR